MAQANIVKVEKAGAAYYFEAKMPSGELLGFNAQTQTAAVNILRGIDSARKAVDADPVVVGPVELNPAPPVPIPPDPERAQFFIDYGKERTGLTLATLSPALQARYKPEYGSLL